MGFRSSFSNKHWRRFCAVFGRNKELVGGVSFRNFHYDIHCFRNCQNKTVHFYRFNIQSITGHYFNFSSCIIEPKIGGSTAVGNLKPHFVTGFVSCELAFYFTVNQKGVIIHVTHVHGKHPLPFVGEFCLKVSLFYGFCITLSTAFFYCEPVIGVVKHPLNIIGVQVCPLAQDKVLRGQIINPRSESRIFGTFFQNHHPIHSNLLLQASMWVIPVGSVLDDRKRIRVGWMWWNGFLGKPGNPIFFIWKMKTVPVQRSFFVH